MINGNTKIAGVFGFPIEHSLSPQIHNKAFEILKLNCVYIALKVAPDQLEQAVAGIKAMDFMGINVTIPHKQAIIPFLDSISDEARAIGAVNTVKNDCGKLIGYSTDLEGFLRSSQEKGISLKGKKVLILGGGGAARSLALGLALQNLPASITLLGRTLAKVENILNDAARLSSIPLNGYQWDLSTLEEQVASAEILVNCTSLGMHPETERNPVPKGLLHRGLVVHDIVYNPLRTKLLAEAAAQGCTTIDGLGMLLHQGIAAFEIWTGAAPPVEPLRQVALAQLSGAP